MTDATPVYGGLAAAFGGTGAPLYASNDLKKFTQEIRLASAAKDRLEWQVGGYYTHEKRRLVQNLDSVAVPDGAVPRQRSITVNLDSTYRKAPGSST